jgi:hypothetical protein
MPNIMLKRCALTYYYALFRETQKKAMLTNSAREYINQLTPN